MKEIKRGDLYYADLRPIIGSEQGGVRPVLIIQNDVGNHFSPTVIAAAITSRRKNRWMPTHVRLYRQAGLSRSSCVMLEQVRTIDRVRLIRYIGSLDEGTMEAVDTALAVSMGMKSKGRHSERGESGRDWSQNIPGDRASCESAAIPDGISARRMQEVDRAIAVSFGLDQILISEEESPEAGGEGAG